MDKGHTDTDAHAFSLNAHFRNLGLTRAYVHCRPPGSTWAEGAENAISSPWQLCIKEGKYDFLVDY